MSSRAVITELGLHLYIHLDNGKVLTSVWLMEICISSSDPRGLPWVFAPSSFSSLEGALTLVRETDDEMPTNMHAHDVTQPDLIIYVKSD
jgi:hypothetical protein